MRIFALSVIQKNKWKQGRCPVARGQWVLTCTATNYEDWVKKHDHIYDITLSENI